MHRNNYVHSDIKVENIRLRKPIGTRNNSIVFIDFGGSFYTLGPSPVAYVFTNIYVKKAMNLRLIYN